MTKKLFFVFACLLGFVVLSGFLFYFFAGKNDGREEEFLEYPQPKNSEIAGEVEKQSGLNFCNSMEKIEGLSNSQSNNLKKLAQYQELCDSFVSNKMMFFSSFTSSRSTAERIGERIGNEILEYQKFGIVPIIVLEPADDAGYVSLRAIAEGEYQNEIEFMFKKILDTGVDPQLEQIWIPYPEINTPTWNKQGFSVGDFGKMIRDFDWAMKVASPNSKMGILLNSKSYNNPGAKWENGEYASFGPYLEKIPQGSVDFLVVQGFPWTSGADQQEEISLLDPHDFIKPDLIVEAAKKLEVGEIWINTGTFRKIYADDSKKEKQMSAEARKQILTAIINVGREIKDKGFLTRIHLFAQDKSTDKEAVDWSYSLGTKNEHEKALFDFIWGVYDSGLEFSVFDYEKIQ